MARINIVEVSSILLLDKSFNLKRKGEQDMKRIFMMMALCLICSGAIYAQKFALIDMEYILKQVPSYADANKQMEALGKQWQAEVEKKAGEAKSMYEAYQKASSTLTAAQKSEKENAIIAKEKEAADLRKKYFGPEGEMAKQRDKLIGPIQDAVYNAVKQIATQRGYDIVFDRASAQSMIFASPKIDISNEVLMLLGYSN